MRAVIIRSLCEGQTDAIELLRHTTKTFFFKNFGTFLALKIVRG